MLETGIGRAHNVALSTLPNFSLQEDVSASKRFWGRRDIVEPEIVITQRGTIAASLAPGTGCTPRKDLIERLTVSEETIRAGR